MPSQCDRVCRLRNTSLRFDAAGLSGSIRTATRNTPSWNRKIKHLHGGVCIDAAWWTASRSLDRLVVMLGEMVEYKNFHDDPKKPPFPWDADAARWSRLYRAQHPN